MGLSTNALCTKVQAMYGQRLGRQEYQELCHQQSISEIVSYLQQHPKYQEMLGVSNGTWHRNQIEERLEANYFVQCKKLTRYVPKEQQAFYHHEIMYVEIQILMDKILHVYKQKENFFNISLTKEIASSMSFDIYGLLPITTMKALKLYLQETKYASIVDSIEETKPIDSNVLERQFMELYFDSYIRIIKRQFKGTLQRELLDMLQTDIEMQNIVRIYRLKKYFAATPEEIQERSFLKHKRMSNRLLQEVIQAKDITSFMQILQASRYSLHDAEVKKSYIEQAMEVVQGKIAKKYMRFSREAPLVYMAYCTLQKIEMHNIKHIIESVRYQKEAQSIENMLIYM